ncbi:ABC-type transport auxiliary lipoprotein family protein [Microvirga pudoricolor]|uniref:ABC-type transport auxiliary lipoprotein family protein n=1 Tax=Microvirga pudoricolor TaxID=2778729 RepID=UPI0019525F9C|nr:ABC-type transport auxiliary lipoprotein family protein [Microvirga pudoricolor]MBM6594487.1 membrane integrity-associated transporter subunit PqiC [Microvirga pudoricolor]
MIFRLAPVLLLASLAGACSSSTPTTYDLSAPTAQIRGAAGRQILVATPAALQALSAQQIVVKDVSGTVTSLGDGQWADSLPSLIQTRLINTFENASQIRNVSRPSSGAVADAQIISELRSFELRTPNGEAYVEMSVKIVSDIDGKIIAGRIFRASVPVTAINAQVGSRALDQALSVVMLDIVRWVSRSPIPSRDAAGPVANPA